MLAAIPRFVTLKAAFAENETQTLSRNDPSQMPGQTRGPHQRTAAKAMPEGGQTAVAYPGEWQAIVQARLSSNSQRQGPPL